MATAARKERMLSYPELLMEMDRVMTVCMSMTTLANPTTETITI